MQHKDGFIENVANGPIYYQLWRPETAIKASLLLVHGLAEHSGRYLEFAEFLCSNGISVYALDLPGHGKSGGERCYIERFAVHQQAITKYRRLLSQWFPSEKLFLMGHSMGGLLATEELIDNQEHYAGAIFSAPALQLAAPPLGRMKGWVLRQASRYFPHLGVQKIDANWLSRDQSVVDRYLNDFLNFAGKLPARCVDEMLNSMRNVEGNLSIITVPLLILHGEADSITAVAGSQQLHKKSASKDKQLILFPQLYHEILNEPERQQVYDSIVNWVLADERKPKMTIATSLVFTT